MAEKENEKISEEVKTESTEKTSEKKSSKNEKIKNENKQLESKIAKLNEELKASNDKYLLMLAEYDNFRKRSQKEKEGIYSDAYNDALKNIIPVFDNLERALMFSNSSTNITEGLNMILKQFGEALASMGIESYGERGDEFDPVIHNAVMTTEDPELGDNVIAEVLQKGYKKGDKVLRHAIVKVANT